MIGTTIQGTDVIAADNNYKVIAKAEVVVKIHEYADKYSVSYSKLYNAIDCETAGTFYPAIQSKVKYKFSDKKRGIVKGTYEESYGLAQIHLPDHPDITLEQTNDIDFSINYMASNLVRGKNLWSCIKA